MCKDEIPLQYVNWLYSTPTAQCGCGERDNDPRTPFSRAFMPMLFVSAAALLLAVKKERAERHQPKNGSSDVTHHVGPDDPGSGSGSAEDTPKANPKRVRLYHLDFARIACVACVVSEHSGGSEFSAHNWVWVQQWVVPFLYLVSGISFMLSRSSIWTYELRLFAVLLVGCGANAVAYFALNASSLTLYVPYQMGYVMVLMILCLWTFPLKKALIWRAENPSAPATIQLRLLTAFWGILSLGFFVLYVGGWDHLELLHLTSFAEANRQSALAAPVLEMPLFFARTFGFFFLACLTCCSGKTGLATWILMAVSYTAHVFVPYDSGSHPIGADLFVIGMVSFQWPAKFKKRIAAEVRQYWMVMMAIVLLTSNPMVYGRCDLMPLNTTWERLRYRAIEFALVSLMVTDTLNSRDSHGVTPWLNMWSLWAYCFHVALARMLPLPYGAAVTYGSVPIFYLFSRLRHRRGRLEQPQELPTEDTAQRDVNVQMAVTTLASDSEQPDV
eukprot:CAMPEP_0181470420 /NCGR_PEP_ID=MMETSP1110-20121109/38540_1 /TAXON_ID=174948 /ORGANISM="Symbiodinium sp., Strain CCMP421" /LENGTH=499 /DNA_ID=CAMNT_0023595387 /DNA_START=223 /DNA_END=1722 /DNA_ORIENTATION=-